MNTYTHTYLYTYTFTYTFTYTYTYSPSLYGNLELESDDSGFKSKRFKICHQV